MAKKTVFNVTFFYSLYILLRDTLGQCPVGGDLSW